MVRWERSEPAGSPAPHRRVVDPVALAVLACDSAQAVRHVSASLQEEAWRVRASARAARKRARDLRRGTEPVMEDEPG